MIDSDNQSTTGPWYIVFEALHPFPHFGLDGLPWPLPDTAAIAMAMSEAMLPLPVAPGGCLFNGCFDRALADTYFQVASRQFDSVYLVEIQLMDVLMPELSGIDVGMPSGGFSVIGQEICKTAKGHRKYGHLINDLGLFPTSESMRAYLEDRARRQDSEGLEYLDESIAVQIGVRQRGGLRAH